MHTVIVTAAGLSSRLPEAGGLPKWGRRLKSGRSMLSEAIAGIWTAGGAPDRVVVAFSERHRQAHGEAEMFRALDAGAGEVMIVGDTASQVETAQLAIVQGTVAGPITIRDCDSLFRCVVQPGNGVACVDLHTCGRVNAGNKSYPLLRPGTNEVIAIAERKILGPWFCCGAYSFADAGEFYQRAHGHKHVSGVIGSMLSDREFRARLVSDYTDLGTLEDWEAANP